MTMNLCAGHALGWQLIGIEWYLEATRAGGFESPFALGTFQLLTCQSLRLDYLCILFTIFSTYRSYSLPLGTSSCFRTVPESGQISFCSSSSQSSGKWHEESDGVKGVEFAGKSDIYY